MDNLTDKAINLAARHAADFVRLLGRQEQERQELLRRHWTEMRTLQLVERAGREGLPYEAPTVTPLGDLFDLFDGVVRPPADARPGVPIPVARPFGDYPPPTKPDEVG